MSGKEEEFFHLSTEDAGDAGDTSDRTHDESNPVPDEGDKSKPSLESLGVKFMEQKSLEESVEAQANKVMAAKDVELEQKRLDRALKKYNKIKMHLHTLEKRLDNDRLRISQRGGVEAQMEKLENEDLKQATNDIKEITDRLHQAEGKVKSKQSEQVGKPSESKSGRLPDETEQEYLIRTGKVTAFGSSNKFIEEVGSDDDETPLSHQNLKRPNLEAVGEKVVKEIKDNRNNRKKNDASGKHKGDEAYVPGTESDEEEEDMEEDDYIDDIDVSSTSKSQNEDLNNIDDGDESFYQHRLKKWIKERSTLRKLKRPDYADDPDKPEWEKSHPTANDAILNDKFHVPGDIYPSLFDYQKTAVQWLWELYSQKTGGIIGDEMGLGKTVEVIAFLAGLQHTGLLKRPILVVCPATVMRQWCNEFHRWWPPFRAVILHSIGSGMGGHGKNTHDWSEDEAWNEVEDTHHSSHSMAHNSNAKELIHRVVTKGNVIITTYVGVRIYSRYLLPVHWGYVVLDEGHKVRNPNSYVTLNCKQLKTPNRVILSGTPIQNNLVELWSLFDFIFPGRLGTLPVFQKQFCIPINLGGYANATNVQVQTAYKCAVILKDLISPYLLRRVKADVAQDLPKKSEMVLFCKLTPEQRELYENFLHSEDLHRILKGKRNALYGIDILRKICNHPDLVAPKDKDGEIIRKENEKSETASDMAKRSGKLQVVSMLLQLWQKEGRKTLIFTQTRQMLDILQTYMDTLNMETHDKYAYLRMDGTTPIGERQRLVDSFNTDPKYMAFLLTTRVGGLGINLTGANRVIIYDPDWNPSTDIQARERAWRLGQKKDVTIYRLMIAGTIEEKIYHRQIFKQFLTNKILKDPKQKRFFKMTDMYDLFTLGDPDTKGTETADMFGAKEKNYGGTKERKSKFHRNQSQPSSKDGDSDDFLKVSKIKGVASVQEYDTGEASKAKKGEDDDTGLVTQLFKVSGVHSALQPESVWKGSNGAAYNTIETEANRIAISAVDALRESRKMARKSKVSVPTWTGVHGSAGKINRKRAIRSLHSPSPKRKMPALGIHVSHGNAGISSSSIIQGLKHKKSNSGVLKPIIRRQNNDSQDNAGTDQKKMQKMVYDLSNYMSGLDGYFSTSSNILDHLNVNVRNEKEVKVLRSMLKSICKWDKVKRGWVLNEEFR